MSRTVCLMNDSFPPLIDGVANTVVNYATYIQKNHGAAVVATPYNPDAHDDFPFPVVRYRSFNTTRFVGYRAGYPFSVEAMRQLKEANIDLIHTHCPFVSTFLARTLRSAIDVPVVFTYHTKFDVDIAKIVGDHPTLQEQVAKVVVANVQACDEVWVVSRGAGENMRSLGYQGDYVVMENGVEFPKGRLDEDTVRAATADYDLPEGVPVFLFVGRMMWYKGIRIILDALDRLRAAGKDFRMVFIGDGTDRREVEDYAAQLGLGKRCVFTGAIRDREALRAWYCRADLFLFPSTYDTNGIVVREAAACGLGSILVRDSCAAEGVTDGQNGLLIQENAESMTAMLLRVCDTPGAARRVGENAMNELYLSWEDSVKRAAERYEVVLERYQKGKREQEGFLTENAFKAANELMSAIEKARDFRADTVGELKELHGRQKETVGRVMESLWQYLDRYL